MSVTIVDVFFIGLMWIAGIGIGWLIGSAIKDFYNNWKWSLKYDIKKEVELEFDLKRKKK